MKNKVFIINYIKVPTYINFALLFYFLNFHLIYVQHCTKIYKYFLNVNIVPIVIVAIWSYLKDGTEATWLHYYYIIIINSRHTARYFKTKHFLTV